MTESGKAQIGGAVVVGVDGSAPAPAPKEQQWTSA
jgi:hypothetical protein